MAKKPRKSKKSSTANAGASKQPVAVLYRLDAGSERGDAVRSVLLEQGIRVKTVTEAQLLSPVGALVGMTGMKPSSATFEGPAPDVEFMLLHNVSSDQLNTLLSAMRAANASVGCKAQVTQYNRLWPLEMLIREVSREHEALSPDRQL